VALQCHFSSARYPTHCNSIFPPRNPSLQEANTAPDGRPLQGWSWVYNSRLSSFKTSAIKPLPASRSKSKSLTLWRGQLRQGPMAEPEDTLKGLLNPSVQGTKVTRTSAAKQGTSGPNITLLWTSTLTRSKRTRAQDSGSETTRVLRGKLAPSQG
jgi:hypothetical protein